MGEHQTEQSRFAVALAARRIAPRSEFGNGPIGWVSDRRLPPLRRVGGPDRNGAGLTPLPPPREVLELGRRPLPSSGLRDLDEGITEAFRLAFATPGVPRADAIGAPPASIGDARAEAKAPKAENVALNFDESLTPPVEAPPPAPASNGLGNFGLTPSQRDWLDLITAELAAAGY